MGIHANRRVLRHRVTRGKRNSPVGEEHHNNILSAEDVVMIKQLIQERQRLQAEVKKLSHKAIGKKFGVSASCIRDISLNYTWKHITVDPA